MFICIDRNMFHVNMNIFWYIEVCARVYFQAAQKDAESTSLFNPHVVSS